MRNGTGVYGLGCEMEAAAAIRTPVTLKEQHLAGAVEWMLQYSRRMMASVHQLRRESRRHDLLLASVAMVEQNPGDEEIERDFERKLLEEVGELEEVVSNLLGVGPNGRGTTPTSREKQEQSIPQTPRHGGGQAGK